MVYFPENMHMDEAMSSMFGITSQKTSCVVGLHSYGTFIQNYRLHYQNKKYFFCMLHENVVIVCFHVLQFHIREVLVNATHVVCRCTNIWINCDKLCAFICPQYIKGIWHIILIMLSLWRLQPYLFTDAQVPGIRPTFGTIIHAQKSPQHVFA